VRQLADIPRWCDDVTDSTGPARFARRSLLVAAVLGRRNEPEHPHGAAGDGDPGASATSTLVYTVTGRILDVSPHVLVLRTERGEQRFPLDPSVEAWRGGTVRPAALRQGDHAIVRRKRPGGPVVDRIWAQAGRVTGTIIEREGPATLLVDEGPAKGRKIVMIAPRPRDEFRSASPGLSPAS
jgi:hypothetical protein